MIANVCGIDRVIRAVIALILIIIGVGVGNLLGWIIGAIGLYLIYSAIFSYCIVNSMIGLNSCKVYIKDPLRDHEMK